MKEDSTRTVRMLLDDHLENTGNIALQFAGTSSSSGGKYSAAWYSFNATSHLDPLSLNATAGLRSLRFVVDGKLEDQGGLGFPIQDSFMFSQTTCLTSQNSGAGQLDVAVRIEL
jgi:hypothetical protein